MQIIKILYICSMLEKEIIPELTIHGIIDFDTANRVVAFLNYFKEEKQHVRFRINSLGGSVFAGQQIMSAMQNFYSFGLNIAGVNEGVCDSTAAWIFAMCTKGQRFTMPYGSAIIHNPHFVGEGGDLERLEAARTEINTMLQAGTGLSEAKVKELMDSNVNLKPDQLIKLGFADKILKITNAPTLAANLTRQEIFNLTINHKLNTMQKLAEVYNLAPEASEAAFVEVAKSDKQKIEALSNAVKQLESEKTEKATQISELENKVKAFEVAETETFIKSLNIGNDEAKTATVTNLIKEKGLAVVKAVYGSLSTSKVITAPDIANEVSPVTEHTAEQKLAIEYSVAMNDSSKMKELAVSGRIDALEDAYVKNIEFLEKLKK